MTLRARLATATMFTIAATLVIAFYEPPRPLMAARPLFTGHDSAALALVEPSANAFGRSGEVKMRFALPGQSIQYPLEVRGDPSTLTYAWVRVGDTTTAAVAQPLAGADVVAPQAPGFYRLALVRGAERRTVDGMTLAVLVPFSQKLGAMLNGYRIGTYLAEKLGSRVDRSPPPVGFVEVGREAADLPITKHLLLSDFMSHDRQDSWPRYAAVNPRVLDKLELVIAEIARRHGDTSNVKVSVDVHSGFRAPWYNREVERSAKDSRHQYGDAADVAIDANFDGRYTIADSRLVAIAVDKVEAEHPDLVGGMGLYTSRRYHTPYVHIDARGTRARWRA